LGACALAGEASSAGHGQEAKRFVFMSWPQSGHMQYTNKSKKKKKGGRFLWSRDGFGLAGAFKVIMLSWNTRWSIRAFAIAPVLFCFVLIQTLLGGLKGLCKTKENPNPVLVVQSPLW
jgi:hypothetical protein